MTFNTLTNVIFKAFNRHKLPSLTLFTLIYCFALSAVYGLNGPSFLTLSTVVFGALFILYPMVIMPKNMSILMPRHTFYQGHQTRLFSLLPLAFISVLNTFPNLNATPAMVLMSMLVILYSITNLFFSTLTLEEQFRADHANNTSSRLAIEMQGFELTLKTTPSAPSPLQYYCKASTQHLVVCHVLTSLIALASLLIFIGTFNTPWVLALLGLAVIKACMEILFSSLGQSPTLPIPTTNIAIEVTQ